MRAGAGQLLSTVILAAGAGCGGDAPPASSQSPAWFEQRAAEAGLDFRHDSGHRQRYFLPEIMCGGAALLDMDGDGDLDAYLVQAGRIDGAAGERPPNRLFRNRGDGTFEAVTSAGDAGDRGYGMGVATGDYDNDGDADLYVTNCGPDVLLRNDGGGRFTNVTAAAGVGHPGWGAGAAFFDADRDGDLDLFVANYLHWSVETELDCFNDLTGVPDYCSPGTYRAPTADVLYRNEGDGTFTDVSEAAGIAAVLGTGLGVVAADFTGDGPPDVFVANDGMLDRLWVNDGAAGFSEEALRLGCAVDEGGEPKAGMGVTAADVDDDGDLDLLVCNLRGETDSLHRNDGGLFFDATAAAGLAVPGRSFTRFGMAWVDFDNDGQLDLYQANGRVTQHATRYRDDPFAEPNLLLRGTPEGRFEEVRPRGGTAARLIHTSRAAAFGDVDGDGGVDVLVVNRDAEPYLLRNVAPRGNWIMFEVLNRHGADAIGAAVTMEAGDRTIRRDVGTAYSYLAASDPRVHVGLGEATAARAVTVTWPDGATESFGDRAAGSVHVLRRGAGRATEPAAAGMKAAEPAEPAEPAEAAVPVAAPEPEPRPRPRPRAGRDVRLGHFHWPGEEAGGVPPAVAEALDALGSEQVALYVHWRACWRDGEEAGADFGFDPRRYERRMYTPAHRNHRGVPPGFDGIICIDFERPYWWPFGRCERPVYANDRWRRKAVDLFTTVARLLERDRPDAQVFVWNLTPTKPCSADSVRQVLDAMDGVMVSTYLWSEKPLERQHEAMGARIAAVIQYRDRRADGFEVWGGIWDRYQDQHRRIPVEVQREHIRRLLDLDVDGIVVFGQLRGTDDLSAVAAARAEIDGR